MKILVADDDPMFRAALKRVVTRWGDEPIVACGGEDAWQLLRLADGPRMAILDWIMPDADGLQVCRRVRHCGREQYVYLILLTVRDAPADLLSGLEAGADDYLQKPVNFEELRLRVQAGRRILEYFPGADTDAGKYRHLCRDLLLAQDIERRSISRDLHEGVAQTLSGMLMNLARIRQHLGDSNGDVALLAESMRMAGECMEKIRVISYQIHPPLLEEVGLPAALRVFAAGGRQDGTEIKIEISNDFGRLNLDLELALFRIVQEAVAQVKRKSAAREAVIRLVRDDSQLMVEVSGRGGAVPQDCAKRVKLGSELDATYFALRERIEQHGGRLEVLSQGGMTIAAVFPVST